MATIPTRWLVNPRAPREHFAQFPDVPPLIVQILYNRGVFLTQDVSAFIAGTAAGTDPFLLKGVSEAVAEIQSAISTGAKIVVYGDYDADGVTATALLVQAIQALGGQVTAFIPDRFSDGYGLNQASLAELAGNGAKLIITVDCGIRSIADVIFGRELGLKLIITDHHHVSEDESGADSVPPALAVINPKQKDCPYPFKDLAGVGVAYKLVQALKEQASPEQRALPGLQEENLLDLVAIGTVADMVPLIGENRMLVKTGLLRLNPPRRIGVQALLAAGPAKSEQAVTAMTIGFVIGPRLNAAGRLAHAQLAYDLLTTDDPSQAQTLAGELNRINAERQDMTQRFVDTAKVHIAHSEALEPLYLIAEPDFNQGVVGLVSSRLTEEYYRPTLVAHQGERLTRGSGRSIPEFDITRALDQCADLLVKYGGHAAAAGFTVENKNLEQFRTRLTEIARRNFDSRVLQKTIAIDAEINLRGVKYPLVRDVHNLQPFGYGNPAPNFVTRNLEVKFTGVVGRDKSHLKMKLFDGQSAWDAIGFGMAEAWAGVQPGVAVDAVYTLELNTWNNQTNLQLNLIDLRRSDEEGSFALS